MASVRLPGKPLRLLAGKALIVRVWERVTEFSGVDRVVVATDSGDILRVIEDAGGEAVLTASDHRSGTDRVAEVSSRPEFEKYAIIVNVQGDEPELEMGHVSDPIALVEGAGWDVATCAAPLASEAAWRDPSVVKVVRADNGAALYFSRAPLPHPRDGAFVAGDPRWLHHVGVYVYRKPALERWVSLPPSRLETTEQLEQLRVLGEGIAIGVAVVAKAPRGIDTEEDLVRAQKRWASDDDEGSTRHGVITSTQ